MGRPRVEVVNSNRSRRPESGGVAVPTRQGLDVKGYKAYLSEFYGHVDDDEAGSGEVSIEKKMAARQFLTTDNGNRSKQLLPMNLHFFRNLMQSWNQTGTLPPLTDEENAMLSSMYQIWNEHRAALRSKRAVERQAVLRQSSPFYFAMYQRSPLLSHGDDIGNRLIPEALKRQSSSAANSPFGSAPQSKLPLSVSAALSLLRDHLAASAEFKHIAQYLAPLLVNLEILVHAHEPTGTQARQLVQVLASADFTSCLIPYLEKRATELKAPLEGNTSHALALACLYDCQCRHLGTEGTSRVRILQLYMQAAVRKDSVAAMQLAEKYAFAGAGWTADPKLCLNWYKFSAELSNPIAQHKMGLFYDEGLTGACVSDITLALEHYSKAAEFLPESMHNIAKIYEDRRGPTLSAEESMATATSLYSIAAARGFPLSQVNLGRLLLLGEEGVARDREAGKRLLTLAAESGDSDAQMVVGMIHATQAFECFDLPLSEYWLKASSDGGKPEVAEHLSKVREQMRVGGLVSLPPSKSAVSKNAESAKQRGNDFAKHGLFHAAALEFSNAYLIYSSRIVSSALTLPMNEMGVMHADATAVMVDRLEVLLACGRFEDAATDAIEILKRSVNYDEYLKETWNFVKSSSKDKVPATLQEKMRSELCRVDRDGRLNFFLETSESARLFRAFTRALVELSWYGDIGPFWTSLMSLSTEQFNTTMKLLVEGLLDCGEHAGKCAAFLARASSRGKQICSAIFNQGGLPVLITSVSSFLTPSGRFAADSLPAPSSSLNYFCCNGCATIANLIRFMPSRLTSEIILCCNGLLLLIRLTCSGWEAVVGDATPLAGHVNSSREGVQALSNLAVMATEKVWKELLASKCVTAFSAVVTGALLDLTKWNQRGAPLKSKLKPGKGHAPTAVAFAAAETEAERNWQESFSTLELGVGALARVMEVCPLAFSKEISATPLMQQLQKIFKMDVLPSSLRTNTAFILYSMTCAKDQEASKLLQDGVTRSAIKDILQEHELTLNPGGERYPWTLEQLFAYVSRGLVAWAGNSGPDLKGAKGSDRSHLIVTCSARIPSTNRPITSPYANYSSEARRLASEKEERARSIETSVDPPASFTFESLL